MKTIPVTLKHTAHIETPSCEDGVFYQFCRTENIHIRLHGIDFTIMPDVPVTDVLRQMLEDSARRRLSLPVVAEASKGEVCYSLLFDEEDREKFRTPDWNEKIAFHGVEAELLAVSLDGTPLPTLEEALREAKRRWLCPAYVMWACDLFPGFGGPSQVVIQYNCSVPVDGTEDGQEGYPQAGRQAPAPHKA